MPLLSGTSKARPKFVSSEIQKPLRLQNVLTHLPLVKCRTRFRFGMKSAKVFPILLATTRVNWLGIEGREITRHLPILLEGILRDVFSQRASAAWQGAPPQKVAVSILLPGRCNSDYWLDYLQSQRHFWPSLTTRFASMDPLKAMTLRRERQRLKSKHLWDTIDLDWDALYNKLYVHKPTGLSRFGSSFFGISAAGVSRKGLL